MTAADILRERARGAETLIDGHVVLTPAEVRAVADLMEAVRRYPGLDAQRAALERLIAGEPARIEGERDADR